MTPDNPLDTQARLWDLIKDIRFAMFTTRHANGHLHSRPMTTQNSQAGEDDTLWFFMPRSSDTVADLLREPMVNIAYGDADNDRYVSVSGRAVLDENPQRRRALWTPAAQAWFPQGVDDPDLAVVRVAITHADYWEVKDNRLTRMLKTARSAITGKPPQDVSEHGRVQLRA